MNTFRNVAKTILNALKLKPDRHTASIEEDITERKQAEEALEKSRNLLAESQRIGNVGGWEFNIDTKEVIWTEEVFRIHEVEQPYRLNIEQGINFYTPESRPVIEQAVQRAIEYGEPFDVEMEGKTHHYIQLLAAEIWQYMVTSQTQVTKEVVETCAKQIVELKKDYYFELFDRQSLMQKQLLIALAYSGNNIFSATYTKSNRLSAASTTQKSVLALMESGIIDKTDSSYFISDPFFKRFLQNCAS